MIYSRARIVVRVMVIIAPAGLWVGISVYVKPFCSAAELYRRFIESKSSTVLDSLTPTQLLYKNNVIHNRYEDIDLR